MNKYRVYVHINGSDTWRVMIEFDIFKQMIEALGWDYFKAYMLDIAESTYKKHYEEFDDLKITLILVRAYDDGSEDRLHVVDIDVDQHERYVRALNKAYGDELAEYIKDITTGKRKLPENAHFYPNYC